MQIAQYINCGNISYSKAWELQTEYHKALIAEKLTNRNQEIEISPIHKLLLCEHNPVFTLGRSGSESNLLLSEKILTEKGFEFFKINRGGDITYHGPGQITGYPILDLENFYTDVHRYVRDIEQTIINTIAHFDINGERLKEYTGVWVKSKNNNWRKICAIGVHMSRWVTLHGFALNVNTNISHFDYIIPCGIIDKDKEVTSISKELDLEIDIEEVKIIYKNEFAKVFGVEWVDII